MSSIQVNLVLRQGVGKYLTLFSALFFKINNSLYFLNSIFLEDDDRTPLSGKTHFFPSENEVPENEQHEEVTEDESATIMKIRFGSPDVIQIVAPPDLSPKKLTGTSLLKEPEIPEDTEPVDLQGVALYEEAIKLLGTSSARDTTSLHYITSVGKTQNVEQAYNLLQQASIRGHKRSMEMVAWAEIVGGPLPLDIVGAIEKFTKLAKEGYPNSMTGEFYLIFDNFLSIYIFSTFFDLQAWVFHIQMDFMLI